ncbi:sigma-70 family RNA polymerase sigma factor [Actinacidiphila paucisporea]|uniref:hypothetical protein n=1 Tax=Actinacidiphila paucisporea TaxID=310782 RepID=UPI00135653F9|nr:hypothetical protein [Actinacidiphila paucisporea]
MRSELPRGGPSASSIYDGLGCDEVARPLPVPQNTIRPRLHDVLIRLRACLGVMS